MLRRLRPAHLWLLLGLVSSCRISTSRQLGEGEIRGSVTVQLPEGGEEPGVDARVRIDGSSLSARVDARGRFVFRNVPPGKYRLKLRHERTTPGGDLIVSALTLRTSVEAEDAIDLGKLVVKALGGVQGVVTDASGGPGFARLVVEGEAATNTDETGAYSLSRVEPGTRVLSVLRDVDGATVLFDGPSIDVPPRVLVRRDFTYGDLAPAAAGSLSVRARLSDSEDHSGIVFRLLGDAEPIVLAPTAADGAVSGASVPAGVYTIEATRDGYLPSRLSLVSVRGPTDVPDLLLISASCLSDTGNPLCAGLARDDTDGDGRADYEDDCPDDPLDQCIPAPPPVPDPPRPPTPEWDPEMAVVMNATGGAVLEGQATVGSRVRLYKVNSSELGVVDGECPGEFIAEITVTGEPNDPPGTVRPFSIPVPAGEITANEENHFRAQAVLDDVLSTCSEPWTLTDDSQAPPVPTFAVLPLSPSFIRQPTYAFTIPPEPATGALFRSLVDCETPLQLPLATFSLSTGRAEVMLPEEVMTADGEYRIAVRAADALGNTSACAEAPSPYVFDTTPPTLQPSDFSVQYPGTLAAGGDPAWLQDPGTLVIGSPRFGTEDVTTWDYNLRYSEGALRSPCTTPDNVIDQATGSFMSERTSVLYDLPPLPGGSSSHVYLCLRARDHVGNDSAWIAAREWIPDDTAPAAPLFEPGQTLGTLTDIVLRFTGEILTTVEFFEGTDCTGRSLGVTTVSGAGDGSIALNGLAADATTQLSARATDRAGWVGGCVTHAYTNDRTPPDPAQFSVTIDPSSVVDVNDTLFAKPRYTGSDFLSWTVSGPAAGEAAPIVWFKWVRPPAPELPCDGPVFLGGGPLPFQASFSEQVTGLPDGTLVLCMNFADALGNGSVLTEMARVEVDGTPPVVDGLALDPAPAGLGATATWNEGTDPGAGLARYELGTCAEPCSDPTSFVVATSGTLLDLPLACRDYRVGVRAVDRMGLVGSWFVATTRAIPPAPANVKVVETIGRVELTWDAVANVSEYSICAGDASTCFESPVATAAATDYRSHVFTPAPATATHLSVRATGPAGCLGLKPDAVPITQPSIAQGSVLTGAAGSRLGAAVIAAGDLLGLGRDQFLVGAPGAAGGIGEVRLASMSGDGNVTFHASYVLQGETAGDEFGSGLSLLGDVTGDGVPEFAVGAPGYDVPASAGDQGAIYIFNGVSRAQVRRIVGGFPGAKLGKVMARGADLNRDGVPDLLVGTPDRSDPVYCAGFGQVGAGMAFVYSGSTGAVIANKAYCYANGQFAASVDVVGDVNGDGCQEFLIGSKSEAAFVAPSVWGYGRASLSSLCNSSGALLNGPVMDMATMHYVIASDVTGTEANRRLGTSVANVGDLDGDGFTELVFGAPGMPTADERLTLARAEAPSGPWNQPFLSAGKAHDLYASTLGLGTGVGFGSFVGPYGDVTGDGRAEFVASLPSSNELLVITDAFRDGSFAPNARILARFLAPTPDAWLKAIPVGNAAGTGIPALVWSSPDAFGGAGAIVGLVASTPAVVGGSVLKVEGARGQVVTSIPEVVAEDSLSLTATLPTTGAALPSVSPGPSTLTGGTTPSLLAGTAGRFLDFVRLLLDSTAGPTFAETFVRVLPGWVRTGATGAEEEPSDLGRVVVALGDVFENGPNCPEIAIGTPHGAAGNRGLVRVLSCRGDTVWTGTSPTPGDGYGTAITPIGNAMGDGLVDFAIGIPLDGPGAVELRTLGPPVGGNTSWLIRGAFTDGNFGAALSSRGVDEDGDFGIDLVVGAPDALGGKGRVGMYGVTFGHFGFGQPAQLWSAAPGVEAGERLGATVALVGDVNADGFNDVAVGYGGGCSSLRHGGFTLLGLMGNPIGEECATTPGGLGTAFASLGNLDGVAGDEFAVSAPGANAVYVYGAPTTLQRLRTLAPPPDPSLFGFGRALASRTLDGPGGSKSLVVGSGVTGSPGGGAVFALAPMNPPFAQRLLLHPGSSGSALGSALDVTTDIDGDGFDELAVGAPRVGSGAGKLVLRQSRVPSAPLPAPVQVGPFNDPQAGPMGFTVTYDSGGATLGTVTMELGRVGESTGTLTALTPISLFQNLHYFERPLLAPATRYWIRLRQQDPTGNASPWSTRVLFTTDP